MSGIKLIAIVVTWLVALLAANLYAAYYNEDYAKGVRLVLFIIILACGWCIGALVLSEASQ